MKFGLKRWFALAAWMLITGGRVISQEVALTSNYDEAQGPAEPTLAAPYGAPADYGAGGYGPAGYGPAGYGPEPGRLDCGNCGHCEQCRGREREWFPAVADHCPRFGIYSFSGFESWRGISEGTGPNNNGVVSGLNVGVPIRPLDFLGIGAQVGMSSGVYDFMGRPSNGANESNRVQSQYMVTYGFFRRADADRPFSFGAVQDWSINDNFGTLSNEPTLSQFRGQIGYAIDAANEIGVWNTIRDRGYSQMPAPGGVAPGDISFRSYNQTNIFWHHKWCPGGADTRFWVGLPSHSRFDATQGGTLGEILFGGSFSTPIGDHMALYSNVQYMRPSSNGGVAGSTEDFFDFGVGLAFYPGATARSRTVAGRSWMPLMPVANNGSFLVDRNQ